MKGFSGFLCSDHGSCRVSTVLPATPGFLIRLISREKKELVKSLAKEYKRNTVNMNTINGFVPE